MSGEAEVVGINQQGEGRCCSRDPSHCEGLGEMGGTESVQKWCVVCGRAGEVSGRTQVPASRQWWCCWGCCGRLVRGKALRPPAPREQGEPARCSRARGSCPQEHEEPAAGRAHASLLPVEVTGSSVEALLRKGSSVLGPPAGWSREEARAVSPAALVWVRGLGRAAPCLSTRLGVAGETLPSAGLP